MGIPILEGIMELP